MAKFLVKRIFMALLTVFLVATITFFLMNAVPGNPWLSEKTPPPGQTHVKIFCFKSLNYYLKNAKNGKIPLGGVMLLRESLEEIDDFRVK
ncbi:MAG: hypothetical protein SOU88_07990, partial [Candidatus Treponema excrementipullorum]|nr:hypothetical protein [Candidatus Treponema excrementipullorum]